MSEKVNILMVDDQPAKLLSYEAILSELGENLIKATSGREALECLLKNDVAVVLMDVSMPEMNGFELAEMIREHPRFRRTAIIFISAIHLTDLDRLKGYERGAVDYISVPVVPELLRAKVSVFAELHRKAHELESLNRQLEQRVADRTQELEAKAEMLQELNRKLMVRNAELDAIMRTAPDVIFSSQAEGFRDYLSERFYEYTGAVKGSANGYAWMEYVHPEDLPRLRGDWKACVEAGSAYESEYRLRDKGGTYRWFRARAVPVLDDGGNLSRWYGTCADIHDSKLLEKSIRENTVLLEKAVQERTEALRRLSSRLMTMQDEERRRIARELHDSVGQELAAAKMMLDSIILKTPGSPDVAVAEASSGLDRAIQEVRTMSHLLHPPLLDEVGLVSALRWYLEGLTKRSGIETSLEVDPPNFSRLPRDLETAVFRIIQEALTNVFRHSQASQAWVILAQQNGHVGVTVRDNGKGLREETVRLRPGSVGVGIGGMRQRVEEFGGALQLGNADPGAVIEVLIPLAKPSTEPARATA
jgi:PAS domain S-box-containing protein